MNEKLDEFLEQELEKFPSKDVIVYYERNNIKLTYGFYAWGGHNHSRITISEFIRDGFEKSDIKELREEAEKITVIETSLDQFEVINGKTRND
jgi:hypothetical protein